MKINTINTKGFSLLEMLLVIAIVSIIALYAVDYIKQNNQKKNVEQSARQMQIILQAAQSYYSDKAEWPTQLNDLIPNFITEADLCSPWPGRGSSECANQALYRVDNFPPGTDKTTAKYFTITIDLPNSTLAQQLRVLLPGGQVQDKTVKALIMASSEGSSASPSRLRGWISSAGTVQDNDSVAMPSCGKGYEGHIILTPLRFSSDQKLVWRRKTVYLTTLFYINGLSLGSDKDFNFTQNNTYVYEEETQYKLAYFFTFCLPDGRWLPTIRPLGTVDYLPDFPTSNDSQCDINWQNYNKGTGINRC